MTYAPVSCFHTTLTRRGVMRLGAAAAATGLLMQNGQAAARQTDASPTLPAEELFGFIDPVTAL